MFKNCPKLQEIKWIQSSCHLPAQFLNEENKNVKRLSFNGENCQNGTTIHKKAFSEEQYLSLTNLTLTNTQLNYNEMITNLKLENFVNLKMLQLSDKNLNNVFIESENLSEFVESFKFFQGAVVEILQNTYPQSLKFEKKKTKFAAIALSSLFVILSENLTYFCLNDLLQCYTQLCKIIYLDILSMYLFQLHTFIIME